MTANQGNSNTEKYLDVNDGYQKGSSSNGTLTCTNGHYYKNDLLQHFIKSVAIWCVFTICNTYFASLVIGYEFLFLKIKKKKPFRIVLTES